MQIAAVCYPFCHKLEVSQPTASSLHEAYKDPLVLAQHNGTGFKLP